MKGDGAVDSLRIGFIGFGEAAFHISEGLIADGITFLKAFDINANKPEIGEVIRSRANSIHVVLTSTMEELLEHSDIVFCTTSAKYALSIAEQAKTNLRKDQIYVDLNAASPMVKKEIASVLKNSDAWFVDAAVMEAVPPHRHKVPILVSGDGAEKFSELIAPYGMNISVISKEPGNASAIKMFRSIFMKGFTMLLLETLSASHEFGVEGMVLNSLERTLQGKTVNELSDLLITRSAIHAERRIAEMNEVMDTLNHIHMDQTMSMASRDKLQWLADMKLNEHFNYQAPDHYNDVLEVLKKIRSI